MESGSGSKTFFETTNVDNQLWFWKYSPIFLFSIQPNLGPFLHFLGLLGLFFGVVVSFKILFGTYLCRKSTLVLKVKPYLFFNMATFEAFFCTFLILWGYLFGHLGLFLGSGPGSKIYLEPTYVHQQLWFWKYHPIFSFLIRPNLGPFCPFSGLFLGLGSSSKTFSGPTYID